MKVYIIMYVSAQILSLRKFYFTIFKLWLSTNRIPGLFKVKQLKNKLSYDNDILHNVDIHKNKLILLTCVFYALDQLDCRILKSQYLKNDLTYEPIFCMIRHRKSLCKLVANILRGWHKANQNLFNVL